MMDPNEFCAVLSVRLCQYLAVLCLWHSSVLAMQRGETAAWILQNWDIHGVGLVRRDLFDFIIRTEIGL
jgi:hypothetical protein